jgi:hypothetical protein
MKQLDLFPPTHKVIYVAGPFRGPTAWAIAENVRHAERWAYQLACCGAMPLVPHTNTLNFHGELTDQFWLDGTLELMRRCDGAVFIPGWRLSAGSRGEWQEAERLGLPRFDGEGDTTLAYWLDSVAHRPV